MSSFLSLPAATQVLGLEGTYFHKASQNSGLLLLGNLSNFLKQRGLPVFGGGQNGEVVLGKVKEKREQRTGLHSGKGPIEHLLERSAKRPQQHFSLSSAQALGSLRYW